MVAEARWRSSKLAKQRVGEAASWRSSKLAKQFDTKMSGQLSCCFNRNRRQLGENCGAHLLPPAKGAVEDERPSLALIRRHPVRVPSVNLSQPAHGVDLHRYARARLHHDAPRAGLRADGEPVKGADILLVDVRRALEVVRARDGRAAPREVGVHAGQRGHGSVPQRPVGPQLRSGLTRLLGAGTVLENDGAREDHVVLGVHRGPLEVAPLEGGGPLEERGLGGGEHGRLESRALSAKQSARLLSGVEAKQLLHDLRPAHGLGEDVAAKVAGDAPAERGSRPGLDLGTEQFRIPVGGTGAHVRTGGRREGDGEQEGREGGEGGADLGDERRVAAFLVACQVEGSEGEEGERFQV